MEERTMKMTQRMIGLSVLVILAVLGTGWAVERASHPQRGVDISSPAQPSDSASTPVPDERPAATEEYDRSDLLLSQG
jgi:hypothetical protein